MNDISRPPPPPHRSSSGAGSSSTTTATTATTSSQSHAASLPRSPFSQSQSPSAASSHVAESPTTSIGSPTSASASSAAGANGSSRTTPTVPGAFPPPPLERVTVPSACVACRSKHLKCDGRQPCSRCSANDFECVFVKSRRGFKGPRRNPAKTPMDGQIQGIRSSATPWETPTAGSPVESCPMVKPFGLTASTSTAAMAMTAPVSSVAGQAIVAAAPLSTSPSQRFPPTPPFDFNAPVAVGQGLPVASGDRRTRCLHGFFQAFFPAHPFILPQPAYQRMIKERGSLAHLEAAVQYVGSLYVEPGASRSLANETEQKLYGLDCPKDGFRVQGLLLLCLGLDGNTHQEKALGILNDAIAQAMELGMNTHGFASDNGQRWPTLEESWRRTWWELFMTDGMIAGTHQKSMFPLKDVACDVDLPCEELDYLSGDIPRPHAMLELEDDTFETTGQVFSSFAYRIAAIQNLGRLLTAKMQMLPGLQVVDRVDAHLVNWNLHLPPSKRNFINNEGQLDEMLFQAHMITAAATIVLHRDFSELDSSVAKSVTSCAPHHSIAPGSTWNLHAAKTIRAAQEVSKLVTIPVPITRHTHFFTCVITLSAIVHLSVWSAMMSMVHDEDLKQQLRLNIGGLKALSAVWPSAERAFGQVKGVAQEIFKAKRDALSAGYWAQGQVTEEEVLRQMLEDQTVMRDMQLL